MYNLTPFNHRISRFNVPRIEALFLTCNALVKQVEGGEDAKELLATARVPKLHVRHLFGRVRPRTWRFEGFLDRTIIIF